MGNARKLPAGMKLITDEQGRKRFHLRPTMTVPGTGKQRSKKATMPAGASRADADLALRDLQEELEREVLGLAPRRNLDPTLREYAHDVYMATELPDVSGTVRANYEGYLRHILGAVEVTCIDDHRQKLPPRHECKRARICLGDMRLSAIQREDVVKWRQISAQRLYNASRDPDPEAAPRPTYYKPRAINAWLRLLKSMLQTAVVSKKIPADPTMKIKILAATPVEGNFLTPEQGARFLDHLREHNPQFYAFMALGYRIGCRAAEIRPLRWDTDVVFEPTDSKHDGPVAILQRSERRGQLWDVKGGTRTVPLTSDIVGILKDHRRWLRMNRPDVSTESGALVFPGYGGWRTWHKDPPAKQAGEIFLSPTSHVKPLRDSLRAVGIKVWPISGKSMRRTFITALGHLGLNDSTLRASTGHKSLDMQMIYTEESLPAQRQAMETYAKVFPMKALSEEADQKNSRDIVGDMNGATSGHSETRRDTKEGA